MDGRYYLFHFSHVAKVVLITMFKLLDAFIFIKKYG